MRNKTFISSMVGVAAAVAVAGSANAAFYSFADLSISGSVTNNGGFNTTTSGPAFEAVGSPSGTGGPWASGRYLEGKWGTSSVAVGAGSATLTAQPAGQFGQQGSASMRWAFDNPQDLTGLIMRLNVTSAPTSISAGGGQLTVQVFSDAAGTQNLQGFSYGSFTTTGNTDIVFTDSLAGARSIVITWQANTNSTGSALTLGAIQYNGVPAPGALALLGVGGLVGARRRRA